MPTEVENDPFFQLLTDALRAGPASPPWREAVAKLREQGGDGPGPGSDEYRLLIEARQNLEVGKGLSPGPPRPGIHASSPSPAWTMSGSPAAGGNCPSRGSLPSSRGSCSSA